MAANADRVVRVAGILGATGYDGGPAETALFHNPRDLCVCGGSLFVLDQNGCVVRKIVLDTGKSMRA